MPLTPLHTHTYTGAGVTTSALEAVKDAWSWSVVKKYKELGLYPMDNLKERLFIDGQGKRYKSAAKIQVGRNQP